MVAIGTKARLALDAMPTSTRLTRSQCCSCSQSCNKELCYRQCLVLLLLCSTRVLVAGVCCGCGCGAIAQSTNATVVLFGKVAVACVLGLGLLLGLDLCC